MEQLQQWLSPWFNSKGMQSSYNCALFQKPGYISSISSFDINVLANENKSKLMETRLIDRFSGNNGKILLLLAETMPTNQFEFNLNENDEYKRFTSFEYKYIKYLSQYITSINGEQFDIFETVKLFYLFYIRFG